MIASATNLGRFVVVVVERRCCCGAGEDENVNKADRSSGGTLWWSWWGRGSSGSTESFGGGAAGILLARNRRPHPTIQDVGNVGRCWAVAGCWLLYFYTKEARSMRIATSTAPPAPRETWTCSAREILTPCTYRYRTYRTVLLLSRRFSLDPKSKKIHEKSK